MHEQVQDYYGRQLTSSDDLKTDACCDLDQVPNWLKPLLAKIHPDVLAKYYGCGLVCPELLAGARVLDLGCGSGRDVYALAQCVGPKGEVVGVDMTDEQLDVARATEAFHRDAFGYSNTRFVKGYIEKLDELGFEANSFDVVISNCVINLSQDKGAVLRGVKSLLKPGGEFYFSDVYCDRRVPEKLQQDPVLYGECLGGALYWKDFLRIANGQGFADPRLVEDRPLAINDSKLEALLGNIRFFSATYRLFNLDTLESACEDYGQAVRYLGTIPNAPDGLLLDSHHYMETGAMFPVCGNTWQMLKQTRFSGHFEFYGNFDKHFGIFKGCGEVLPFKLNDTSADAEGGCC